MKKSIYFILTFFFSFQISVFSWSTDPSSPVVICDAPENQTGPRIVKLSDGNFIILWVDERRGDVPGFSWKYKDIYGQKLNPDGEIQWTENGISIVEGSGEGITFELQTDVRAVSDEAGGIIFSWTDASGGGIQNNNVRINKLDGSGSKLWGEGGILLQEGDSGSNEDLCSDGEGGVFAVWEYGGYRLWYPRGKVSHIGNDGSILTNYGSISSQGGDDGEGSAIANPMVIYSGTGEAIVGWEDSRDGLYYGWRSLRVQKFSSGTEWTAGGIRVSLPNNVKSQIVSNCAIVSDGAGGVIAFWTDERNGNKDIFAQRVNSSGNIVWTEGGITVCNAEDSQFNLQAVSDGSGGAVIVWEDKRNGNHIYAQHINENGELLWEENGVLIGAGKNPRIIRNSDGTYYIFWTNDKILAQRIGDDGIGWWSEGGVEVYNSGVQDDYEVVDVDDGVVVVFSNNNIYAQKIYKNGTLDPSFPLTITTDKDLPQGALEEQYNLRIGAVGGNGERFTWQIVEGNLPEGLSLNSTTGIISGIPAELGTFNFTISASDGVSTAQKQFRLFVQIDTGMEIFDIGEYPAVAKGNSYLVVTRESIVGHTSSYIYCQFFDDNGYKDGDKMTIYENDTVGRLDVAYNPVNNKYLIVFKGGEYPDYKLYGIFIDGETHQAGDAFVIMDENCRYPDVEVNPQNGNFLVVASEDKYGGKWKGIVLNKDGQPQTEIFDIGEKSGWPYNCSIAFNPDNQEFLVSYTYGSSKYIWGRILKNDGTIEEEKELASSSFYIGNCKLTYNQKTKKYFVVYYTSTQCRILGRVINSDGTPSGEPFYISKTELDEHCGGNVATTSSGNTYAFWGDRSDENGEYDIDSLYIYAQKIGENGSEFEEDYLLTPYTGLKYTPIAVEGNTDDNLLVLWKSKEGSSYKVYGVFYNPSSSEKGDINGDEKIDISDVILCLRQAIGLDPVNIDLADMNNDGIVNISDVILILRKAIGLD